MPSERERERARRCPGVREREWTYFGGNHVRRGAVMCMNQVGELAFEADINASTKRKDLAATLSGVYRWRCLLSDSETCGWRGLS